MFINSNSVLWMAIPFYRFFFSFFSLYKWNWSVCVCPFVRHHFEDDHYFCLQASQTPITIHIPKAYDESYSKIMKGHKYKDKDNDKDNDKDTDTDKVKTQHMLHF